MKLLLSVLLLTITGCATIISGLTSEVKVNSFPEQAYFKVTNKEGSIVSTGYTPSTVILKNSSGYFSAEHYIVNYSKLDYKDCSSVIDRSINNWYFGNILIGGLFGMLIVDPLTGAMWTLDENTSGSLEKK